MKSLLVALLASTAVLALRPDTKVRDSYSHGLASHQHIELAIVGRKEAEAPGVGTELLEANQVPASDTTTKSWFDRMGDAFWGVIIGLFIVIPFSIALLWVNERRAAQLDALIGAGQGEAETVEVAEADLADYDGCLVHLNSEEVKGLEPVQDKRFPDVKLDSGCVKLRTAVEVLQWEEAQSSETKKNNVGGGSTTTTNYTYKKAWSASKVDSSQFRRSQEHRNTYKVQGLNPGTEEVINGLVKYGEPYRLEKNMVNQLGNYQDLEELIGGTLAFQSHEFSHHADGYYYCPANHGTPSIGDFRVKAEYVPDGPASVLALQKKDKKADHTFVPYRTVRRRLCGGGAEVKDRLLAAAAMTPDELYEQDRCLDFGPFCCLCACCNLVTMLFSNALPPQIYSLYAGSLSKSEVFKKEQAAAGVKKWLLRLVGWLGLWFGLNMVFQPFLVILDLIPFLGPWVSSATSYLIGFITFLATLVLASILVSLAYLIYRPLIGVLYLGMTAGLVYGIHFLSQYWQSPTTPAPAL